MLMALQRISGYGLDCSPENLARLLQDYLILLCGARALSGLLDCLNRASYNKLPTKSEFYNLGIISDNIHVLCRAGEESYSLIIHFHKIHPRLWANNLKRTDVW